MGKGTVSCGSVKGLDWAVLAFVLGPLVCAVGADYIRPIMNRVMTPADVECVYRIGRDLPVRPSTIPPDEFVIEALIDDTSELHILPDLIYWTNNSKYAKPGRARNRYAATWINGRPWRPHWMKHQTRGLDLSSAYGLTIEPALYVPELVAVGPECSATMIERGRIVAHRDRQSLVIRFEDWLPGARWYRIRLYRWRNVDPVKCVTAPEPYCGEHSLCEAPYGDCVAETIPSS